MARAVQSRRASALQHRPDPRRLVLEVGPGHGAASALPEAGLDGLFQPAELTSGQRRGVRKPFVPGLALEQLTQPLHVGPLTGLPGRSPDGQPMAPLSRPPPPPTRHAAR